MIRRIAYNVGVWVMALAIVVLVIAVNIVLFYGRPSWLF